MPCVPTTLAARSRSIAWAARSFVVETVVVVVAAMKCELLFLLTGNNVLVAITSMMIVITGITMPFGSDGLGL